MIQLEHVSKVYSGVHKAVDDCSFTVEDGKITGFIGPTGRARRRR